MFTRFLSFILIITTLLSGTRALFYFGYTLNKDYIANVLCVNKDKPEMHCNGKCYLANKIKQAEEKEKKQEQQSQEKRLQEALVTERFILSPPTVSEIAIISPELTFHLPKRSHAIFHPPNV